MEPDARSAHHAALSGQDVPDVLRGQTIRFRSVRSVGEVLFIIIGGFLGAGKTTAITWLAHSLQALGKRTAIVMNDQGERLVDTAFGEARGLSVAEVTGGCFCCRFDDLAATTMALVERDGIEVVLAEAVGSCTDLTATVIRPLRAHFMSRFIVAPLTVLVDPVRLGDMQRADAGVGALMPYLFDKQLEDGRILALNKRDLLRAGQQTRAQPTFPRCGSAVRVGGDRQWHALSTRSVAGGRVEPSNTEIVQPQQL